MKGEILKANCCKNRLWVQSYKHSTIMSCTTGFIPTDWKID